MPPRVSTPRVPGDSGNESGIFAPSASPSPSPTRTSNAANSAANATAATTASATAPTAGAAPSRSRSTASSAKKEALIPILSSDSTVAGTNASSNKKGSKNAAAASTYGSRDAAAYSNSSASAIGHFDGSNLRGLEDGSIPLSSAHGSHGNSRGRGHQAAANSPAKSVKLDMTVGSDLSSSSSDSSTGSGDNTDVTGATPLTLATHFHTAANPQSISKNNNSTMRGSVSRDGGDVVTNAAYDVTLDIDSSSGAYNSRSSCPDDDIDPDLNLSTSNTKLPFSQRLRTFMHRVKTALWHSNVGSLMVLVVLTILISAFDWVMWKKTLNRFHSKTTNTTYTFFLLQAYVLLMLVCNTFAVILQYWVFKSITPEMKAYPKRKFWLMSGLDTVAVLCSSMAGAAVAGHVQTLLSQLNLPLTMLFSALLLGTLYILPQYIGAALIIAGAITAAVPAALHGGSTAGRENKAWGIIVYTIGIVPLSFSNVYREYMFRGAVKLNIFYWMFWTSLYQFILGFLTLPVLALPVFGGVALQDMPSQFSLGFECLIGRRVAELECDAGPAPLWGLLMYIVLNFIVSILRLWIIQYGSAVLLQVTNAMALLFSNLIFCIPAIMGEDTEEFNYFDAIGLVVVFAGFILFRVAAAREQERKDKEAMLAAAEEVAEAEAEAAEAAEAAQALSDSGNANAKNNSNSISTNTGSSLDGLGTSTLYAHTSFANNASGANGLGYQDEEVKQQGTYIGDQGTYTGPMGNYGTALAADDTPIADNYNYNTNGNGNSSSSGSQSQSQGNGHSISIVAGGAAAAAAAEANAATTRKRGGKKGSKSERQALI